MCSGGSHQGSRGQVLLVLLGQRRGHAEQRQVELVHRQELLQVVFTHSHIVRSNEGVVQEEVHGPGQHREPAGAELRRAEHGAGRGQVSCDWWRLVT